MVLHLCRHTIRASESVYDSIYHVIAYCRLHFQFGLVVAGINIEVLLNRILERIVGVKFYSFDFWETVF